MDLDYSIIYAIKVDIGIKKKLNEETATGNDCKRFSSKPIALIFRSNHCHVGNLLVAVSLFYNFMILNYILRQQFLSYESLERGYF